MPEISYHITLLKIFNRFVKIPSGSSVDKKIRFKKQQKNKIQKFFIKVL